MFGAEQADVHAILGGERPFLFPDAEIPENHIQNVLDIDTAGQAAERGSRGAQLLRHEVVVRRQARR